MNASDQASSGARQPPGPGETWTLQVRIAAQALRPIARHTFVFQVHLAFGLYRPLRLQAPRLGAHLEAWLVDDFARAVRQLAPRALSARVTFTPERLWGRVVAACLPPADDQAPTRLVFDAATWQDRAPTAGGSWLERLFVVAHELAHPLLSPAATRPAGRALAHQLARELLTEYQANLLADRAVLQQLTRAANDRTSRPVGLWHLAGERYRAALAQTLAQAAQHWSELLELSSPWAMSLEQPESGLLDSVHQVLTLLVHAQALADAVGGPDLLAAEDLRALPVVQRYLAEPWRRWLAALRGQPFPWLGDDEALARQAESALLEVWRRLGLEAAGPAGAGPD